jgi:ABC-type polysaccharide/polyol phosphate export permease
MTISEQTTEKAAARPAASSRRGAAPAAREVLGSLVKADLRQRYGRGRFRLLKWLLDPFALVGVYLILVSVVLQRGGPAPGLSLACAVVPFQLLMLALMNGLGSVPGRASIIVNMAFPRLLIPIASVLTEAIAFGASFSLLALMMAIYGVAPTVALLWLPVVILVTLALAVGFAYPASLLGLYFREANQFAMSMVRALFFLAPGLVTLNQIGGTAREVLKINPLTGLFEAYRDVVLSGRSPRAWELLIPLAWAVALAAVFVPLYRAEQRQFAKVV